MGIIGRIVDCLSELSLRYPKVQRAGHISLFVSPVIWFLKPSDYFQASRLRREEIEKQKIREALESDNRHDGVHVYEYDCTSTSKEISDLEGELSSIRNLLSTQETLIHGLAEGIHIDSLAFTIPDGSSANGLCFGKDKDSSDLEKWLVEFPDLLDVLLAERRVDEALTALDKGEQLALEAKEKETLSPSSLVTLQSTITEHRQKLADQLAEAACQPSTRGSELRTGISALKRLGDEPRAHSLLLSAHYHTTCKAFDHQTPHMEEHILQLSHNLYSLPSVKLLATLWQFLVLSLLMPQNL